VLVVALLPAQTDTPDKNAAADSETQTSAKAEASPTRAGTADGADAAQPRSADAAASPNADGRLPPDVDPSADAPLDAPSLVRPPVADAGELDEDHDRKKPDYDGRGDDYSPSPAVWAPRVVLFPFYAIERWVLRAPMKGIAVWADKHRAIPHLVSWLSFFDGRLTFLPAIQIGNGQRFGVGFTFKGHDLFGPWHRMNGAMTTDFTNNIMTNWQNTAKLGFADLNLNIAYQQRNDLVFYGTGKRTLETDQTRFERMKPFAQLEIVFGSGAGASSRASNSLAMGEFVSSGEQPSAADHLGARFGIEFSDNNFKCTTRQPDICGPDHRAGTPDDRFTLDQNGDAAFFYSGYSLMRLKAVLSVDTRSATSPSSTGARLDIFGRYGEGLGQRSQDVRFYRYGGEASAFVDLTKGRHRVLAARLYVEMVDPISNSKIPFEELITLGGFETMRGFLRARFQGRSAVVASLEYRWPVWSFLDADLFYDIGNAFDEHLKDFDLDWLRSSYGLILRTNTSRDVAFTVSFGIGSKAGSAAPDEFRFLAGTNIGF
jgi:hypothetical protein